MVTVNPAMVNSQLLQPNFNTSAQTILKLINGNSFCLTLNSLHCFNSEFLASNEVGYSSFATNCFTLIP